MKTKIEILRARINGAQAALRGEKLDANPYPETDELHFEWMAAWADVRMEQIKSGQNSLLTQPEVE